MMTSSPFIFHYVHSVAVVCGFLFQFIKYIARSIFIKWTLLVGYLWCFGALLLSDTLLLLFSFSLSLHIRHFVYTGKVLQSMNLWAWKHSLILFAFLLDLKRFKCKNETISFLHIAKGHLCLVSCSMFSRNRSPVHKTNGKIKVKSMKMIQAYVMLYIKHIFC